MNFGGFDPTKGQSNNTGIPAFNPNNATGNNSQPSNNQPNYTNANYNQGFANPTNNNPYAGGEANFANPDYNNGGLGGQPNFNPPFANNQPNFGTPNFIPGQPVMYNQSNYNQAPQMGIPVKKVKKDKKDKKDKKNKGMQPGYGTGGALPGCPLCNGSGYKVGKKGKSKPCMCASMMQGNKCPKCLGSGYKKPGKKCKCSKFSTKLKNFFNGIF